MNAVITPTTCPTCGNGDPENWYPGTGVCVRCRTQEARERIAREDYERLGHAIAFDDSCRRLARSIPINAEGWFDTSWPFLSGRDAALVARAIAYLRARDCLEFHPTEPGWCRHRVGERA